MDDYQNWYSPMSNDGIICYDVCLPIIETKIMLWSDYYLEKCYAS